MPSSVRGFSPQEGENVIQNVDGPFSIKVIDNRMDFFKSADYKRCHEELMIRLSKAYLKHVYEGECFVFKFERRNSKFLKVVFTWSFLDVDPRSDPRLWGNYKPIVLIYFGATLT